MKDLAGAGQQGGSFLGNLLNPLIGGTNTTTVTEKPNASSQTTTAVVIIVVVLILSVVAYLVYKNKR